MPMVKFSTGYSRLRERKNLRKSRVCQDVKSRGLSMTEMTILILSYFVARNRNPSTPKIVHSLT